jgi:hypothetical protein
MSKTSTALQAEESFIACILIVLATAYMSLP